MSELQVLLAAVGGLVVAGFIAHGAWTSRKATPKHGPGDAARQEPGFDPDASAQQQGDLSELPLQADLPAAVRKVWSGIDPLIDEVAVIELDEPVSGDLLITHLPGTRRVGSKPMLVEARAARAEGAEADPPFEALAPGRRYVQVQTAIQLVNRQGALNEIEFSEFVAKTNALADAVGGSVDLPDMLVVVARARELDAFASQHDAQLAVELRAAQAAWSPGYVQQQAAKFGFVPGAFAGRLVVPSAEPGAPPVLALSFDSQAALADDPDQAAIRRLNLSLDVPQSPQTLDWLAQPISPFELLRATIAGLCESLGAVPVDEAGRAIVPEALDGIAGGLGQLYDALAERGLHAGSPTARRLFS